MDSESRERLVRVEEGIKNIASILEKHTSIICPQLGCAVTGDIVSLKVTQKWTIWLGKTAIGGMILVVVTYIIPKFLGMIGVIDGV